jgi:cytoskeletal protein RodZ
MRIFEIASAEEQMALWKLITTSVWTAIDQQVQQQAKERSAKAKSAATKGKKRGVARAAPVALKMPAPLAQPPAAAAQPSSTATATPAGNVAPAVGSVKPVQPTATNSNSADAEDDAETVQPMRKKLR